MSQLPNTLSINAPLEPLSRCLTDESSRRIVAFQIEPIVQKRVSLLAKRANSDLLTANERAEYEAYIDTANFIAILKLKVQHQLKADRNNS